jgi:hypothetical protein
MKSPITAPTATDNCSGNSNCNKRCNLSNFRRQPLWLEFYDDAQRENIKYSNTNVIIDDVNRSISRCSFFIRYPAECEVTTLTAPTATDKGGTAIVNRTCRSCQFLGEGTTMVVTWTYDDGNKYKCKLKTSLSRWDITGPVTPTLSVIKGQCSTTVPFPQRQKMDIRSYRNNFRSQLFPFI